jgi:UDP-3-O-[3-hydroxymyristoyl] glucosamine N-acyltransferase
VFGKKIIYHRIFPNTVARDGKLGGICLDFYDKIPEPYKSLLYIGKNVMIKTGTILCGEGFHFSRKEDNTLEFTKHKHGLQIHDNVWIGSNCTLDRGRVRDTVIGKGTKIDNGVHISHNVIIGENCIIGQGASLLGSCEIGDNTEIWSNAVVHQGVKVGKNSAVGANTYLRHNVGDNMCAYFSYETGELVVRPMTETKKYSKKREGGVSGKKCLNGKCGSNSDW